MTDFFFKDDKNFQAYEMELKRILISAYYYYLDPLIHNRKADEDDQVNPKGLSTPKIPFTTVWENRYSYFEDMMLRGFDPIDEDSIIAFISSLTEIRGIYK